MRICSLVEESVERGRAEDANASSIASDDQPENSYENKFVVEAQSATGWPRSLRTVVAEVTNLTPRYFREIRGWKSPIE